MNNLHMSEILSSKYDVHLDYQITMYDQLPYKRNADLCGEQNIAMYSGHVIKYYMCDNKEKQFAVDNHDEQIKADVYKRQFSTQSSSRFFLSLI